MPAVFVCMALCHGALKPEHVSLAETSFLWTTSFQINRYTDNASHLFSTRLSVLIILQLQYNAHYFCTKEYCSNN